ncbi:MAG: phosphotransferase family protein [Proteobacteria bacterium]|nr:phosphotransferase family protein [Pseudomonadota bacterium]
MTDIALKLTSFIVDRLPEVGEVRVDELNRIHGGASRETYRFRLRYSQDGRNVDDRLILRLDPQTSLVESEHADEFHTYRGFFGTKVPVPESLWMEEDARWLGRPFFVMREITGCETDPKKITKPPYSEVREKIGEHYTRILAQIAGTDPSQIEHLNRIEPPAPDECWRRELDYWVGMIEQDVLEPRPVVWAAIRWLRGHPPPPAQKISVIHGDYRIGNFLYDETGVIQGILDWEMCHLGDPIEDLTYGMNPLWSASEPSKVGTMIGREKFIALWEEESGLKVEPEALYWWELFTGVKALSIWLDAARKYADGSSKDIILAHTGWVATDVQSFINLNLMRNRP